MIPHQARLGLGTVQFGVDYGISNAAGKTPASEVLNILRAAQAHGITLLDTAHSYGNSEVVLGEAFRAGVGPFSIVTKTPRFSSADHSRWVLQCFEESIERMGVPRVFGLMLHSASDLLGDHGSALFDQLQDLRSKGRVDKIGVSVYDSREIDEVVQRYAIDLIQLPFSVLDRRLERTGHLRALRERGVEIHARSAFLQGLVFMSPDRLPRHFERVRERLVAFHRYLADHSLSTMQAAIHFVAATPEIDRIICGVNDRRQLLQLCNEFSKSTNLSRTELDQFAIDEAEIVDPSRWAL